ncbi:MAG TPA: arginine--tRNA ligase [Anaerolineales bacterium]|nr:arginine--tRNA ligase [Anaerolineales bacterium]
MFSQELASLTALVSAAFDRLQIPRPEQIQWIPIPLAGQWGFGTAVAFQAAALEAKRGDAIQVPARAQEIASQLAAELRPPPGIQAIRAERAYLNAYFETSTYATRVVDAVLREGAEFGKGRPRDERVMVEYAQPNTLHSFHIGHARNVVLGESLARLVQFAGFETIRASYPGDIGLGVITCLWGYRRFFASQEPEGIHARGQWLARIYTESNALLELAANETAEAAAQRVTYDAERRELYRRWDQGDPEIRDLWLQTRRWSLEELEDILRMLDVEMDVFFFESEADLLAKDIVEELVRLGIAEDGRPQEAVVVKIDEKLGLTKEKYRTAVLLRSDGTSLYLAKDLALAKMKFERHRVDRSLYVVDVRQSLYFQQAFKILELWGFPQAAKCYHLAHGFVSLPEGAMSSRQGNVVLFKDVADEAERRVLGLIAEKNPDLPEDQRGAVARQVGLGAIVYAMLSVDSTKDIVFTWEAALSFEGHSAPYIQNAHVRANSILRKAGAMPGETAFDYPLSPEEAALIDLISRFPSTAEKAAEEYKPLIMANYAYEVARSFHAFYHAVPVLQAEYARIRAARQKLTAAARQILATSLWLLDIRAPEVM